MIYFIGAVNIFIAFTLWHYLKLLKKEYYEASAQLEKTRILLAEAQIQREMWKSQYEVLGKTIGRLKFMGFKEYRQ